MERPSRHAKLGVRNGEIVGDRGGLFCASAAKQPLAAQAGRSFRRLCSETIPRKGGVTVKGPPRRLTPYLLVSPFLQRGHPTHGRYKGMRLNSATR